MDRFKGTLAATLSGFEDSLKRFMPATPYRAYILWSAHSFQSDIWAQTLGIPQFAKLTYGLLHDLISEDDWPRLLDYASILNSYLILEAVSDNFGSFLQPYRENDITQTLKRDVLYTFACTAIDRLQSNPTATADLLASAKLAVEQISCFTNSIAHSEQFSLAQHFLTQHTDFSLNELEFGGWSVLVANVEACLAVSDALQNTKLGRYVNTGLQWRYRAINQLLYTPNLTLEERVDLSNYAGLVEPYLAYFIAVLNEIIRPNDRLDAIIENGLLETTLHHAGLLVRLSNDVGTELVQREEYRQMLIGRLERSANPQHTLNQALLKLADELPFLTRMHKDIAFGEFNTSLYELGDQPCSAEVLVQFRQTLDAQAQMYSQARAALSDELETITLLMGSTSTSKLIGRFVEFHEQLYSYPFDSQKGEYATRPNTRTMQNYP